MNDAGEKTSVTVALADGERRTADLIPGDGCSYLCPWCETPVLSPQAWQFREESIARDRERDGEPARQPDPYPDDQAAAWNSQGCPSPACLVNMTAERLAEYRDREKASDARRRDLEALQRWNEDQERKRNELWQRAAAEAGERGACLRCLRKSSWPAGKPRFIRHRTPRFHDRGGPGND
jgi:hypothetical protein